MTAQDQSLQTWWVKHYTDSTTDSPECRICGKMDENVNLIVPECNEIAQNKYKNSDMIKLRHCCIGSGARLMHSRRMKNVMNTSLKRKWEY